MQQFLRTCGSSHVVDQSLDSLLAKLDPKEFYRANRKFVAAHGAIKNISYWFQASYY